mmetsp:Transcript_21669/g.51156  ORF Transcript_21669/g.51156 Transcript_21669/m.51156 type:complete len:221 (-) Transcript_21669:466-1128(-)
MIPSQGCSSSRCIGGLGGRRGRSHDVISGGSLLLTVTSPARTSLLAISFILGTISSYRGDSGQDTKMDKAKSRSIVNTDLPETRSRIVLGLHSRLLLLLGNRATAAISATVSSPRTSHGTNGSSPTARDGTPSNTREGLLAGGFPHCTEIVSLVVDAGRNLPRVILILRLHHTLALGAFIELGSDATNGRSGSGRISGSRHSPRPLENKLQCYIRADPID